jgi:putative endonuclease
VRIFSTLIFGLVDWAARNGFATQSSCPQGDHAKERRHLTGVRGETFAYWYLRRHGYVIICRNFRATSIKGEIDLVGFDGPVLAFIEVKTRTSKPGDAGLPPANSPRASLPEDAVTADKRRLLSRMARQFLMERRLGDVNWRHDVLAIESRSGARPIVRLHKGAFADR